MKEDVTLATGFHGFWFSHPDRQVLSRGIFEQAGPVNYQRRFLSLLFPKNDHLPSNPYSASQQKAVLEEHLLPRRPN